MRIIDCSFEKHADQILATLNDAIATSTALYDYKPRTIDSMAPWFAAKSAGNFPVVGAEQEEGTLLGFATYGAFRAWPAYKYSVEHSVYVRSRDRGKGIGGLLMTELIERATAQDYHVMIGGIDAQNSTSVALHERLGFTHAGTLKQVGFKFGRWLDLAFYQLILRTPADPRDG